MPNTNTNGDTKEFPTWRQGDITCPYCGWQDGESWEYEEDADEIECYKCEKVFSMEIYTETSYTTTK